MTVGDLARDPGEVARGLAAWQRGEPGEAVRETLLASARDLHRRAYTLWVWTGLLEDGTPVWALPARIQTAVAFHPAGPAAALAASVAAAVDAGAAPADLVIRDWEGLLALDAPGLDPELTPIALADRHPRQARIGVAPLPEGVVPGGPPLALRRVRTDDGATGLLGLARATGVHPLRAAMVLAERRQPVDDPPPALASLLRELGCDGPQPEEPEPAPSLEIVDDICPRRRHARKVLQRLLRMGKVGVGYHTEFDHLYRGAAPDERADALAVGEALLRAGLLGEKPSVGQRHVYLRREALPEIHALIERGETRSGSLREQWTAPAPGEGAQLAR